MLSAVLLLAAAPELVTEPVLKYTLPAPQTTTQISFSVTAKNGAVTSFRAHLRDRQGPGGVPLAPAAVTCCKIAGSTSTTSVAWVTMTLAPDHFVKSGEYKLSFDLTGAAAGLKEPLLNKATVVIERPSASINADEIKDRTFWIHTGAKASAQVSIAELTGKASIADLEISVGDVLKKDSKESRPGKVVVTPEKTSLAPGGRGKLTLDFSGFTEAGEHVSDLTFSSPNLDTKTVQIKINVHSTGATAFWWIFFGVLLGTVVQWLASSFRPRQDLLIELAKQRERGRVLQKSITSGTKRDQLSDLMELISAAEADANGNALAAAKEKLTKIIAGLDKLREETRAAKVALFDRKNKIEQALHGLEAAEMVKAELPRLFGAIAEAMKSIDDDRLDEATAILARVEAAHLDLKRAVLEHDIKAQLEKLDKAAEQDLNVYKEKLDEVFALMALGKLDEARAMFEQATKDLREVSTQAFSAEDTSADRLMDSVNARERREIVFHGGVAADPQAHETLRFEVAGANLASGDTVLWDWDDGKRERTTGPSASHAYDSSGTFNVAATIIRSDGRQEPVRAFVLVVRPVLESSTVMGLRLRRDAASFAVFLISLVVATLSGLLALYFGKTFGSATDIIGAIFWGLGLDITVRGFGAIFSKLSGTTTAAPTG